MGEFEKWHGLGNDFIVTSEAVEPELARSLCDRHRGVGADGVLVVQEHEGIWTMVVLNSDGSRPEMCGNGLRCVVGFLAGQSKKPQAGNLIVHTDAGAKSCHYEQQDDGGYLVRVEMGEAALGESFQAPGHPRPYQLVDMGNPHAVSFEPFEDAEVDLEGPAVESALPGGANVEFVRVSDEGKRLEVVVWERGVGRTEACGTGACAVAVAAVASARSPAGESLAVILPGGKLDIVVSGAPYQVSMTGPAVRVFRGRWS